MRGFTYAMFNRLMVALLLLGVGVEYFGGKGSDPSTRQIVENVTAVVVGLSLGALLLGFVGFVGMKLEAGEGRWGKARRILRPTGYGLGGVLVALTIYGMVRSEQEVSGRATLGRVVGVQYSNSPSGFLLVDGNPRTRLDLDTRRTFQVDGMVPVMVGDSVWEETRQSGSRWVCLKVGCFAYSK